jgi:hypothetical protein
VHCASKWPLDRIAPYMSDILREMGRLSKRFPKDVTTAALFNDFLSGKKTLWLILDGNAFVAITMTVVNTIDATGERIATLCDLAGRDVKAYAADLCAVLEQWAIANNCGTLAVEGRKGWEPLLARYGYRSERVLYRKSR